LRRDGAIVWAGLGQRAITPAMVRVAAFFRILVEGLVRERRDVHFFVPKVFAELVYVHRLKR
jgi:hypothetical protein